VTETGTVAGEVAGATVGPGLPIGAFIVEVIVGAALSMVAILLVRRWRGRAAPGPEALVWVGFAFACAARLAFVDPRAAWALGIVAVALGALLAVTIGVDLGWGLAIRLDPAFGLGNQIVVDGVEGRIWRIRACWVEVETADGWLARVPHRRLGKAARIRSARHRTAVPVRFELDLPPDGDVGAARARAKELVLCSPWANLSPPPEVEIEDVGRAVLRVEAYTFGREGRSRLVADVVSAWRG